MDEDRRVLMIGAVLGDSHDETMLWSKAIGTLSQTVQALSADLNSPVKVIVMYHVDGRLAPNEFEGVRTGRFTETKSLLVIQAAVSGGPADDRRGVLVSLLSDAVSEAERYVVKEGLADGLPEIRDLVLRLRDM
jgi:hypothetical protein